MYDLIVIGAGPGGYEAAAHAAHMGKKVALVEQRYLGGTCLNVGCIPAKAFLRSSRLYRECAQATAFGVDIDAFCFNMAAVVARKDRIVASLVGGVEGLLQRSGVEVMRAHGALVGRGRVAVGGEVLEAANVLIATGSVVVTPPIAGIDRPEVLSSDSVFALDKVPFRVAVIGGGYIGLELASFFADIGVPVAVFEMLPAIAAGADADISDRLLAVLGRAGVSFYLSARVTGIDAGAVTYQDGAGETKTYAAEVVLNATGRAPLVDGLGLAGAGVDYSARGIRTDDRGATNVPGLWACGDVTGAHMLAHVATREGIVAVENMFAGAGPGPACATTPSPPSSTPTPRWPAPGAPRPSCARPGWPTKRPPCPWRCRGASSSRTRGPAALSRSWPGSATARSWACTPWATPARSSSWPPPPSSRCRCPWPGRARSSSPTPRCPRRYDKPYCK